MFAILAQQAVGKAFPQLTHRRDGNWMYFVDETNIFSPALIAFPLPEADGTYRVGENTYLYSKKVQSNRTLVPKKNEVQSGPLVLRFKPVRRPNKPDQVIVKWRTSTSTTALEMDLLILLRAFPKIRRLVVSGIVRWITVPTSRISICGNKYLSDIVYGTSDSAAAADADEPDPAIVAIVAIFANEFTLSAQLLLMMEVLFCADDGFVGDRGDRGDIDQPDADADADADVADADADADGASIGGVDSPAPSLYWKINNTETALIRQLNYILRHRPRAKKLREDCKEEFDISNLPKLSEQRSQFERVITSNAILFDAWHPLHRISLHEMLMVANSDAANISVGVRYYDQSSFGFVCPVYTKEGKNVGLTQFMSRGTRISVAEPPEVIEQFISALSADDRSGGESTSCRKIPVLYQGAVVGFADPAAPMLHWTGYCR